MDIRDSPERQRSRREPSAAFVVAPPAADEVPAVIALIGRVYAEYGFVYEPATEVPDLLAFARTYAPPRGAFFVVRDGESVVGSVGVDRVDGETAELHRLYLDAGLRGRGLGRVLVERVLEWCRQEAVSRLILWSDTRFDLAHGLYERMGFVRSGERELVGDPNQTREFRYERAVGDR
jgi:putative acetyltransferase